MYNDAATRLEAKPMNGDWRKAARWYVHKLKQAVGWREDFVVRAVQMDHWSDYLSQLPVHELDALEISPAGATRWSSLGFRNYVGVDYPEFDITRDCLPQRFDVVIAEHVFEHLRYPYRAARNVWSMLNDNGVFLIATPFMVRVHNNPTDYTRWTPAGLAAFLEDCGFEAAVHAWGNAEAVRANFVRWKEFGWWKSLRNQPQIPVVVWAYARKSAAPASPAA